MNYDLKCILRDIYTNFGYNSRRTKLHTFVATTNYISSPALGFSMAGKKMYLSRQDIILTRLETIKTDYYY